MSRNRRNVRRNTRIKEFLTSKNFFRIVSILLAIIIVCIGINLFRNNQERKALAKQQEEIRAQSEEIFSQISENIEETNKNISESDVSIKISAVGDILCSNEMLKDAYNENDNSYDFSHMFDKVKNLVNVSDIVMGTLETSITDNEYNDKNAPIEFARAIRNSGVNLISIANNHSLDNGISGLNETKENLEEEGFTVVGDSTKDTDSVVIREVKNSKIAILSYTCFLDNEGQLGDDEINAVNIYSEEKAKEDIEYAEKEGAEYICVMIHWGDDGISETVSDEQKEIADFFVNNGVDLIIGSHPSCVQPIEIKQNSDGDTAFIAYSLGTYISTLSEEEAKTELVLNIELRKSGKDGKIYLNKVDYTPIYMLDNGDGEQNRFELIDMKNTATSYTGDETDKITKEVYDNLVNGLNRLNRILGINNNVE